LPLVDITAAVVTSTAGGITATWPVCAAHSGSVAGALARAALFGS
jgi:hypothetical protein